MITIRIPTLLRQHCGGKDAALVSAATVGEALQALVRDFPGLGHAVLAETGDIRGYVNVFVNTEDIRQLDRLGTPVRDGDTIHILPSIAGG